MKMLTTKQKRSKAIRKAIALTTNPDVVFFDTETTSFDGEVLALSLMDLKGKVVFNEYCMPISRIEAEAQAIHKLSRVTLENLGAKQWSEIRSAFYEAIKGKLLIIFNSAFDKKAIANTERLHGFTPDSRFMKPDAEGDIFCLMRLKQRFQNTGQWPPLEGGDHTSAGDCRAARNELLTIASAEENPEVNILSEEDFRKAAQRLEAVQVKKAALITEEKRLKALMFQYLESNKLESLPVSETHKASLAGNIVSIKFVGPPIEIPSKYTELQPNKKAVTAAIKGCNPDIGKYFLWSRSSFLRIEKN